MSKKLPINAPAAHIDDFNEDGGFMRPEKTVKTPFGDGPGELPVESGRYLITWQPVCGWCHRLIIIRELLGLQDHIKIGKSFIEHGDNGMKQYVYITDDYDFIPSEDDEPDFDIESQYNEQVDPDFKGLVSLSTFYDISEDGVYKYVNEDWDNQSYYLEKEFKKFHKDGAPDLLPEDKEEDIKEFNEWLYHNVNNGIYKTGFAQSQKEYEKEYDNLFDSLDKIENHLDSNRYLMGDHLTDSDIRLYVSLARFDVAYYPFFNCNRNRIIDFDNIWNYMKELYQIPAFGKTTFFEFIKRGYFSATRREGVIPKGPDTSAWNDPHNRDIKFPTTSSFR